MSAESEITAALRAIPDFALAGGRFAVHQDVFPQPPAVPAWPAVRFNRVSGATYLDVCGDGGEDTDDIRFQVDVVVSTTADARNDLMRRVRAALAEARFYAQGPSTNDWDAETKTFRATIDVTTYREPA